MSEKLSIKDLDLSGKKVLVRVDFNVPIENGSISDITRIKMSLPTLSYILDQGGSLILISHLGRPNGKKEEKYSLKICQKPLEELLNQKVYFCSDCINSAAQTAKKNLKPKEVLLLENLRFYSEEENPDEDPTFAYKLAEFADLYIDDAFASAHRAHSSIVAITKYFPGACAMGFLIEKELCGLKKILESPEKPFYSLIGGSKISTKIGILQSLLNHCDKIFIGGAMAFTFLKAQGYEIGKSFFEEKFLETAKDFLKAAAKSKCKVFFPIDLVVSKSLDRDEVFATRSTQEGIPKDLIGVDLGELTLKSWKDELAGCKTIFWNGPVGVFENPNFSKGTFELATTIASLGVVSVVGGGDSVSAVTKLGLENKFTHLSTGGGASLELIEYGHLPGIDALSNKN